MTNVFDYCLNVIAMLRLRRFCLVIQRMKVTNSVKQALLTLWCYQQQGREESFGSRKRMYSEVHFTTRSETDNDLNFLAMDLPRGLEAK